MTRYKYLVSVFSPPKVTAVKTMESIIGAGLRTTWPTRTAHGRVGDVAIAVSTSGNSGNLVEAIHAAKDHGLTTIGLLGKGGGKLQLLVDQAIIVPSEETPRIQETHITIGHVLCALVEEALFPEMSNR
jgi:DNA-binding MurR/RpiR family transcriptional regulator